MDFLRGDFDDDSMSCLRDFDPFFRRLDDSIVIIIIPNRRRRRRICCR